MTYRTTAMLGVAAGTLMIGSPVHAQTIGYFLPKVVVSASVKQRLEYCPTGIDDVHPMIVTTMTVKPTYVPDQYVEVRAKPGFLAQRSVEVSLRPNGTLESINASSEGQGAKVLGAVVKIGAGVVGLSGAKIKKQNPNTLSTNTKPFTINNQYLECKDDIVKNINRLHTLRDDAAKLASDIANGRILTDGELAKTIINENEIRNLERKLTLRTNVDDFDIQILRNSNLWNINTIKSQNLPAPNYISWFKNYNQELAYNSEIIGRNGFTLNIDVEESIFNQMRNVGREFLPKTSKNIVYLRGIPATATLSVAEDPSANAKALSAEADFDIPQYSRYFTLPAGSGGIFGAREAKVKLSESGTPILLSYGAKGSGADFSELADSGIAAAQSIRDARTEALKRAVERRQAEKDLLDLLDPNNAAADE
jgi:hypothetical protein